MSTLDNRIPPSTDRELLTLWTSHRDRRALDAIAARHGGLVYSLCRKSLRNPRDIEDAFQTTFLLLTKHAQQIRHRESVASWLYSVTVRVCQRMSLQRHPTGPVPDDLPDRSKPLFTRIEFQETAELLASELEKLPVQLREPLVLTYLEGHSYADAAELLNTTENALKCRLTRGRKMLRTRLLKRGMTFSLAFTASSTVAEVTTDAAVVTPVDLLTQTIESCEAGELIASSPPIVSPSAFESITLIKQGTLMTTTTTWQTIAVTTAVAIILTVGGNSTIRGNSSSAGGREVNTEVSEAGMLPLTMIPSTGMLELAEPHPSTDISKAEALTQSQTSPNTPVDVESTTIYHVNTLYPISIPKGEKVDVYIAPKDFSSRPEPTLDKVFDGVIATANQADSGLVVTALPSANDQIETLKVRENPNPFIVVPHGTSLTNVLTKLLQSGQQPTAPVSTRSPSSESQTTQQNGTSENSKPPTAIPMTSKGELLSEVYQEYVRQQLLTELRQIQLERQKPGNSSPYQSDNEIIEHLYRRMAELYQQLPEESEVLPQIPVQTAPDTSSSGAKSSEPDTVIVFAGESVFPFHDEPNGGKHDIYQLPDHAHSLKDPTPRKVYDGVRVTYHGKTKSLILRAPNSVHQKADTSGENPMIVVPHGMPLARVLATVVQNRTQIAKPPVGQPLTKASEQPTNVQLDSVSLDSPPPQSIADVERQRLIKLMDIVSQKKLSLELERDGRPLTKGKDDLDIKNYEFEIDLLKKKLEDLRSEYQRIGSAESAQAAASPLSQPASPNPTTVREAPLNSFAFDAPTIPAPAASSSAVVPQSSPLQDDRFTPPRATVVSEESSHVKIELTSDLPIEILLPGPRSIWQRVDSKTPLICTQQRGQKQDISIRVNREKDGIRQGTIEIRDDFQLTDLGEDKRIVIPLTADDIKLLDAHFPVTKIPYFSEHPGKFNGIDTEPIIRRDAISSSAKLMTEERIDEYLNRDNNNPDSPHVIIFGSLKIPGKRPFRDVQNYLGGKALPWPLTDQ